MKKMLTTLTAIVLSVAVVSTVEAKKMSVATPANLTQQANRTQKDKVDPKAPEAKVVADVKKVVADVKATEQKLAAMRNWSGDLRGYTLAEIQEALDAAQPLMMEKTALDKQIKENRAEIAKITTRKWLGFGKPVIAEGKEETHQSLMNAIESAETRLNEITPAITELETIMGNRRSKAVKAAYAAMFTAVAAIGIDQVINEGKLSAAAIKQITDAYNKVAEYTPDFVKQGYATAKGKVMAAGSAVYGAGARAAGTAYEYGAAGLAGAADIGRRGLQAVGVSADYVGQTAAQRAAAEAAAEAARERAMERTMSIMQ